MTDDFAQQVAGVGALAEPARRALYLYVVAQAEPVSRDQAAAGAGLPRHTAKFHLERLVQEGLLDTEFRRLSGRQGPGAGRPAKLYRRADREVSVSLPDRQYELAGRILAAAVEASARDGVPVLESLSRTARAAGDRIAATSEGTRAGLSSSGLAAVIDTLAGHGYEPREEGGQVVLANCPFHALAQDHTELVCTMNLELLTALVRGLLPQASVEVRLDPAPGRCCVTLATAG